MKTISKKNKLETKQKKSNEWHKQKFPLKKVKILLI